MNNEVMILGSGPCALRIAHHLADRRIPVCLVADGPVDADGENIRLLKDTLVVGCKGYAGAFDVRLEQNGHTHSRMAAAIAVAAEETRRPNFGAYGLEPAVRIWDVTTVERRLSEMPMDQFFATAGRVAFFNGWQQDSHPAVSARMLALCLKLQRDKIAQTFFITGNLKVAGNGLEALCQEAKAVGSVFVKCTDRFPEARPLDNGSVQIDYWDELTRSFQELHVDGVVVDESIEPNPGLTELSRTLGLEIDGAGFAQADNVRRMSNFSNRRGIFIAGSARSVLSEEEKPRDADQAALEISKFLFAADQEYLPRVEIIAGRCVRCLTCHRLCPHGAIDIGSRISIVPQACQSCGICAAGCPARAIEVEGVRVRNNLERFFRQAEIPEVGTDFDPSLVIFCCSRSAGQAHKLAEAMGHDMPPKTMLIAVPCGGAVSMRHLLAAFDTGADGVMLCTCHPDNCKSQQGSSHARKRAAAVFDAMTMTGLQAERLQVFGLAANMGAEFIRTVEAFRRKIRTLGPWTSIGVS